MLSIKVVSKWQISVSYAALTLRTLWFVFSSTKVENHHKPFSNRQIGKHLIFLFTSCTIQCMKWNVVPPPRKILRVYFHALKQFRIYRQDVETTRQVSISKSFRPTNWFVITFPSSITKTFNRQHCKQYDEPCYTKGNYFLHSQYIYIVNFYQF